MVAFQDILNGGTMKTLFENSYNLIVVTDAQLELPGPRFVYVNPAFTKTTGYTFEEIKDKTPRILQGEQTDRKLMRELKEKCQKGGFFSGNTINYKKDGSTYNVEWNISPIKDDDGNITHYIAIQRDITKEIKYKKIQEEKLQIQENELKLKNTIISQQSRMAIMGEMIDSIAHQWMQPLSVIKMNVEFLKYEIKDNITSFEEKVNKQLDHMYETLQEFRTFLQSDKEKRKFSIKNTLEIVSLLLKDAMISHQISLNISQENEDFYITGYENEFKHVLINLINNTKDAFVQNKIKNREIFIETKTVNNQNIITIKDNAGGIPSHIIEQIFEADFTTKENNKGSGRGLQMSKKIVEKHDGTIEVESIDDTTTFTIIINA